MTEPFTDFIAKRKRNGKTIVLWIVIINTILPILAFVEQSLTLNVFATNLYYLLLWLFCLYRLYKGSAWTKWVCIANAALSINNMLFISYSLDTSRSIISIVIALTGLSVSVVTGIVLLLSNSVNDYLYSIDTSINTLGRNSNKDDDMTPIKKLKQIILNILIVLILFSVFQLPKLEGSYYRYTHTRQLKQVLQGLDSKLFTESYLQLLDYGYQLNNNELIKTSYANYDEDIDKNNDRFYSGIVISEAGLIDLSYRDWYDKFGEFSFLFRQPYYFYIHPNIFPSLYPIRATHATYEVIIINEYMNIEMIEVVDIKKRKPYMIYKEIEKIIEAITQEFTLYCPANSRVHCSCN